MKLFYCLIIPIILLVFNCCNHSEITSTWENGKIKEQHYFTNNHKMYKIAYYDSLGNKENEGYINEKEELTQTFTFDTLGLKKEEFYYSKPYFDTITILSGEEKGYTKIIAYPNYFKKSFYTNGTIKSTGFVQHSKKDSVFQYYNSNGQLEHIEHYMKDSLINIEKF
jgi:hypothetical protein